MRFDIIVFDGFETLDAMGPAEVAGVLAEHVPDSLMVGLYSEHGGIVTSDQNVRVETLPFSDMVASDVVLIPGGVGIRQVITSPATMKAIRELCVRAQYVLTVCTGAAVLGRTGLLDGQKATSNKRLFDMAAGLAPTVTWVRKARWVRDGKFYTSSGVTAGIDMTLGFVSDLFGESAAVETANRIEHVWNRDADNDPFCR